MAQLQGKVIAVTGAGSGIGAATARLAAQLGASLSLGDVNEGALTAVAEELRASGVQVIANRVDVSNPDSVDAWIASAIEHFGRLDGAANVAGVEALPGSQIVQDIADMTNEQWEWVLKVNLSGMFYCLRAQLRVMKHGSSIVNISSTSGLRGYPGMAAYVSSKHGVQGLTKTAAKEAGPKGIRINTVAPGRTETAMVDRIAADAKFEHSDKIVGSNTIPLQRNGQPEEIAQTICFALSDAASYTTGSTFTVDGGRMP